MATLTFRDETLSGESLHEWSLDVTVERITVQEIIRSRVYQEVQDHNVRSSPVFQGLVEPEDAEKSLNGWKLRKPRAIDWKRQFERALEAFRNNQVLILVYDQQVESLDQAFDVGGKTLVTFLRLTPLVGG